MNKIMRWVIYSAAVLLLSQPAFALNDTIAVTVGTGTTKTANLIAYGSGRVISEVGVCDPTTENTCGSVSADGAITISPGTLALGRTLVSGTTAAMTGTSSTQVVAAVATKRIYVTRVKCNNSSATGTLVQIQDGSGGTVLDTLAAGASYGGEQGTGSTPLFWTTAGNGLFAQDVTTSASVICTASGYSG